MKCILIALLFVGCKERITYRAGDLAARRNQIKVCTEACAPDKVASIEDWMGRPDCYCEATEGERNAKE